MTDFVVVVAAEAKTIADDDAAVVKYPRRHAPADDVVAKSSIHSVAAHDVNAVVAAADIVHLAKVTVHRTVVAPDG
jgi:hypothetical protein